MDLKRLTKDRPIRIALAEDHPLVRAGLKSMLGAEDDLEVCGETDRLSDLPALIQTTAPDILILDLSLPDGMGLGAIKRLSTGFPALRILICSMHEESVFAHRCLQLGAAGYVHKRAASNSILKAVHTILNGRRYLSEAMTERLLQGAIGQRTDPEDFSLDGLSTRELEVFTLIGEGRGTGEIAHTLHLSGKTIETHREKIKKKLNLLSSTELNRYAMQWFMETH